MILQVRNEGAIEGVFEALSQQNVRYEMIIKFLRLNLVNARIWTLEFDKHAWYRIQGIRHETMIEIHILVVPK